MSAQDTLAPVQVSPVEDIVADMRAGRMVILIDEEDRENEGDLVLAADHVTPEAINFMARFGRGLICLTLTRERCERLNLPPMVPRNGTKMSTAFTVSIEAAEGVTTGISAADRARTVQVAVAPGAKAVDLVQPGHIFPLQAVEGGVLMRAGHTEAGCDLAAMAGCSPAAVICEIMKDDGTMARLPDLQLFAAEHGLKIGTIADLIEHRSRHETLVQKLGTRPLHTAFGEFSATAFRDQPSGASGRQRRSCRCGCTNRCPFWTRWKWAARCTAGAWRPAFGTLRRWAKALQCCSIAAKRPTSC
jgi:3,4-dihydroxy 2-butanone 4-phosphate synthase/GTP cyclohydrolase II